MFLTAWWEKKPLWLKGGVIGLLLCLGLWIFYLTAYNWLLKILFPDGMLPMYSLLLPLITGHLLVLFSHFFVESYFINVGWCGPTAPDSCFDQLELVTLILASVSLIILYFILGAIVGWHLDKKKKF